MSPGQRYGASENVGKFHLAPASGGETLQTSASESPQEAANPARRRSGEPSGPAGLDESPRAETGEFSRKLRDTVEVLVGARPTCGPPLETHRIESDPGGNLAAHRGEQRHIAMVIDVVDGRPELVTVHLHPNCA